MQPPFPPKEHIHSTYSTLALPNHGDGEYDSFACTRRTNLAIGRVVANPEVHCSLSHWSTFCKSEFGVRSRPVSIRNTAAALPLTMSLRFQRWLEVARRRNRGSISMHLTTLSSTYTTAAILLPRSCLLTSFFDRPPTLSPFPSDPSLAF